MAIPDAAVTPRIRVALSPLGKKVVAGLATVIVAVMIVASTIGGHSGPYWKTIDPNSLASSAQMKANENQGGGATYTGCEWTTAPLFHCYNAQIDGIDGDVFRYLPNGTVALAS
jgi:hypothetical protein